ncbi:MAG TPA: cytochrome c oxidase assembly protein [Acidimicrobiales bacterium]
MTADAGVPFPAWHFHPDVMLLVTLLAAGYYLALRHHAAVTGEAAASRRQMAYFAAGVATLFIASTWPVHDLAERYLYSVHMVQHLLMTLIAAPLFLLGIPSWMAEKALARGKALPIVRTLSKPVPNLLQANLVLVLSHWPLVVRGTVEFHALHFVAHAVLLTSALVMWMPVLSPHPAIPRLAPLLQMVYLFLQTILPTIPASFLTFGRGLLYPIYGTFPRIWDISAITDQQVAGLIMKIGAGSFLWVVITAIFFRWYAREELRPKKPKDVLLWDDVQRELERLERPSGSR